MIFLYMQPNAYNFLRASILRTLSCAKKPSQIDLTSQREIRPVVRGPNSEEEGAALLATKDMDEDELIHEIESCVESISPFAATRRSDTSPDDLTTNLLSFDLNSRNSFGYSLPQSDPVSSLQSQQRLSEASASSDTAARLSAKNIHKNQLECKEQEQQKLPGIGVVTTD